VYGERQNIGDKYRNVIGIFMNQIMQGEPLNVFGDGEQTRAFTYIRDIAPALADSAFRREAYNQIFNVGADEAITINTLVREVSEAMRLQPVIRHVEEREEVKHAYCSHKKIYDVFQCNSPYNLREGLQNMAVWAKRHGSRKSKRFRSIEIQKNLPGVWQDQEIGSE
jgi:UDP-glucose 4-epimerase